MSWWSNVWFSVTKAIENDMDVQVQRFDDLNDRGQELSQLINSDAAAVERINSQLLEFQERWDNLVQQMEFQSKEVIYTIYTTIGELSSKCEEFLAERSQFDSDHSVDFSATTCCQSATFVRPLFCVLLSVVFYGNKK